MPLGRTAIQRASTPLIKHAVAYGVSLKNSNRPHVLIRPLILSLFERRKLISVDPPLN